MTPLDDRPAETRPQPLLRVGETCWRVETAGRMAVLVDNAAYFSAARSAILQAQRSITLLGWMFDTRTRLEHGKPSEGIGSLLNDLVRERPQLQVRVLIWDAAVFVRASRSGFPQRARGQLDERIQYRLDDGHPLGACHHQKVLVIDERLAFCSGADFMINRWDTAEHRDGDPRRRMPSGKLHQPRHDLTAVVDGPAATALAELAAERWRRAGGDPLDPNTADANHAPWPEDVAPQFQDVRVAIARTQPAWRGIREEQESKALFLAAIGAARDCIYMESQYFASPLIGDAIEARLAEPDGPEIIVVCSPHSPSLFDRAVMDAARDALVTRLNAADKFGRFRAYAPHTAEGQGVIVHSKLAIIDDRLLRIGSSNLNNRSLGLDTECDLAIDAAIAGDQVRPAIASIRRRLVAHFLACAPEELEQALGRTGSLIEVIDQLDQGRRLKVLKPSGAPQLGAVTAWAHLGDATGPSDVWRPWKRRKGPGRPPWMALALIAGGAVAYASSRNLRGRGDDRREL